MYLIIDNTNCDAVLIDPSDATIVTEFLSQNPDIKLRAILATHHHWDHCGGIPAVLSSINASTPVYGADSRCDGLTHEISKSNPVISITDTLKFNVLFTPCHTTGHVCYFQESER